MQVDGDLVSGDRHITWEDAEPNVAWLTADLFNGGPVRKFFRLVLDTKPAWLQSSGAGTDHPVFQMLLDGGTRLTTSHVTGIPIAEFVVRAVLDHFQQASTWTAERREHRWQAHDFREIHGTTWLIVGLGNIGTEVAIRAKAFGATVLGVRRSPTGHEPVDECASPAKLDALLPRADVVVLAAPGGTDTMHLLDEKKLALLRPRSVVVNVGRGRSSTKTRCASLSTAACRRSRSSMSRMKNRRRRAAGCGTTPGSCSHRTRRQAAPVGTNERRRPSSTTSCGGRRTSRSLTRWSRATADGPCRRVDL